jgi:hypothetical protein
MIRSRQNDGSSGILARQLRRIIHPFEQLEEPETMSATILTFPKTEEEASERSVEEEIAYLKVALRTAVNELVQPAPRVTREEPAAAAVPPEEMERWGDCDRILAEAEMDRQERKFVLTQCHTDAERAYLEENLANLSECHCEVCEAGGNCCGGPFGWTIGELLAAAYDDGIPVSSISPKNRRLIVKAATELAAKLTA